MISSPLSNKLVSHIACTFGLEQVSVLEPTHVHWLKIKSCFPSIGITVYYHGRTITRMC